MRSTLAAGFPELPHPSGYSSRAILSTIPFTSSSCVVGIEATVNLLFFIRSYFYYHRNISFPPNYCIHAESMRRHMRAKHATVIKTNHSLHDCTFEARCYYPRNKLFDGRTHYFGYTTFAFLFSGWISDC